jgi:hypothetical protein
VSDRDPYREVGIALRAACLRAASMKLMVSEHRVFNVVVAATASWSRLSDTLAVESIVEATKLDRADVRRALKRLDEVGIIAYEPGSSERGRPRITSRVGLPAGPDRGSLDPPVPVQTTTGSHDPRSSPTTRGQSPRRSGGDFTGDQGVISRTTRGSHDPPSEEYPRSTSRTPPSARASEPEAVADEDPSGGEIFDDVLGRLPVVIAAVCPEHRSEIVAALDVLGPDEVVRQLRPRDVEVRSPSGWVASKVRELPGLVAEHERRAAKSANNEDGRRTGADREPTSIDVPDGIDPERWTEAVAQVRQDYGEAGYLPDAMIAYEALELLDADASRP